MYVCERDKQDLYPKTGENTFSTHTRHIKFSGTIPKRKPQQILRNKIIIIVLVYVMKGFPGGSDGKESACNSGNLGLIPGLGRSPEKGKGYPLQYSCLENFMDFTVHGVAKNWLSLSH